MKQFLGTIFIFVGSVCFATGEDLVDRLRLDTPEVFMYDSSVSYVNMMIDKSVKEDDLLSKLTYQVKLGELKYRNNQLDSAILLLEDVIGQEAGNGKMEKIKAYALEILAFIYEKKGDYKEALQFISESTNTFNRLDSIKFSNQERENELNLEKKLQHISDSLKLNNQAKLDEINNKIKREENKRLFVIIGSVTLIILMFVVFFYAIRRIKKNKKDVD